MWRIIATIVLVIGSGLVHGNPTVPCYFIFGDSLSDAGNNDGLITMAKANYAPYGVDFPRRTSTGRFSNGRTFVDVITKLLRFQEYIIPFNNIMHSDQVILKGVNYASGGAGIRTETGSHLGDRIWMDRQLLNHGVTIGKLQSMIQGPVADYLNKCLYTVNIGSNDYINNYFTPQYYPTNKLFTIEKYAEVLVAQYC